MYSHTSFICLWTTLVGGEEDDGWGEHSWQPTRAVGLDSYRRDGVSTAQRLLNYRRQAFCHRSVTFLTECHKMCLDVIPRCTGDFMILSIKTLLRNPFAQMWREKKNQSFHWQKAVWLMVRGSGKILVSRKRSKVPRHKTTHICPQNILLIKISHKHILLFTGSYLYEA